MSRAFAMSASFLALVSSQQASANTGVPFVAVVGMDVVGYTLLVAFVEATFIRVVLKKKVGSRILFANAASTLVGLGLRALFGLRLLVWWVETEALGSFRAQVLAGMWALLLLAFPISCAIEWLFLGEWFEREGVDGRRAFKVFVGSQILSYSLLAALLPIQIQLPRNMEFADPRSFAASSRALVYYWDTVTDLHRTTLDGSDNRVVPNVEDGCLTALDVEHRFQGGYSEGRVDAAALARSAKACVPAKNVRPKERDWLYDGNLGTGEWLAGRGILGMRGFTLTKTFVKNAPGGRVTVDPHGQLTYWSAEFLGLTDQDVLVFQIGELLYVWSLRAGKIGLVASDAARARMYFTASPH